MVKHQEGRGFISTQQQTGALCVQERGKDRQTDLQLKDNSPVWQKEQVGQASSMNPNENIRVVGNSQLLWKFKLPAENITKVVKKKKKDDVAALSTPEEHGESTKLAEGNTGRKNWFFKEQY